MSQAPASFAQPPSFRTTIRSLLPSILVNGVLVYLIYTLLKSYNLFCNITSRKTVSIVSTSIIVLAVFITVPLSQHIQVLSQHAAGTTSPFPPSNLTVQNDDHVARVNWIASPDPATTGYKVTWGVTGSLTKTFYTGYTSVNIQPLLDGQTYQVEVQAVDGNGSLSPILGPATAQTDPTVVNSIRSVANGMFDDFNTGTTINPLHWFSSYNNADPLTRVFPFTTQDHLHIMVRNILPFDAHTLRATATMRSLQPFDFTNRTGHIYFDFDWGNPPPIQGAVTDRNDWYMVLTPTIADDINYRQGSSEISQPGDLFELQVKGSRIQFSRYIKGNLVQTWTNTKVPPSLRTINVRKHSVLAISQNTAVLTVDGVQLLNATGINLDFQQAYIYNQLLEYQTTGDDIPYVTTHWDNIGFDAPVGYSPDVVHTYTDGSKVDSDRRDNLPATFTVNIPDTLTGEKAERLFLDVQTNVNNAQATVTVNGTPVQWPIIYPSSTQAFDAHVIMMPIGTLHRGNNSITITPNCGGCQMHAQNAHVEVLFPNGSNTPYTPYVGDTEAQMMGMPPVAPMPGFGTRAPASGSTAHGVLPVEVTADGMYSLLPTGHVDPVVKVEVDVDNAPAAVYTLPNPAVETDQTLNIDTTQFPNGKHTITVRAYGADNVNLNSNDPILINRKNPQPAYNYRTVTFY